VISFSLFAGRAPGFRGQRHTPVEYAYGLWRALEVIANHHNNKWAVHVYHDGNVEGLLSRFRGAYYGTGLLRCFRVQVPPAIGRQGRRYLGCLYRLLAADDRRVEAFVSRDLDDPLDPAGLLLTERRWLSDPTSNVHRQAERYDTPDRANMVNLGWFGQRSRHPPHGGGGGRWCTRQPLVRQALRVWLWSQPQAQTDRYTADEEFLTDVWIPALRHSGCVGHRGITPLQSHRFRRGVTAHQRNRNQRWRSFYYNPRPYRIDGQGYDEVVSLVVDR
jgi:hypothetical protein